MRALFVTGLILVGIVGGVLLAGSSLPSGHSVSRSGRFAVPPETIWLAITDVEAFPTWRADVEAVRRLPDREGRPVWVEEGSSGAITFAVQRAEEPRILVVRVADPALPFGGTWTYEIQADPAGGSALTITEDGEIYNPFFRFMARYVFGYDATLESYFESLEKRFGAT